MRVLRTRWLGRVPYREAWALQRALHRRDGRHLLLLEHPHTFTYHRPADVGHVLTPPADVGAELVRTDRGGDVTYHGPGQLVGYPILTIPTRRPVPTGAPPRAGMGDSVAYVCSLEHLIIDVLADVGLPGATRFDGFPGVWIDADGPRPRKIAAVGVRIARGRSLHGFALNVAPDMRYFGYIVPCGVTDKGVTSLAEEGVSATMEDVVAAVTARAIDLWGDGGVESQEAVWRHRPEDLAAFSRDAAEGVDAAAMAAARSGKGPTRGIQPGPDPVDPAGADAVSSDGADTDPTPSTGVAQEASPTAETGVSVRLQRRMAKAGVTEGLSISQRKPEWLRSRFRTAGEFLPTRHTMRDLGLVTVCEEAGCPNIFDCWADGTATFMINGERCTRACGFCLVDTRKPQALDPDEPERVAEAVARMGVRFAVVTAVARDDLPDGGAGAFAETIRAIRERNPGTQVEVLISDCKGDEDALQAIFDARPDVLNHNLETVLRLQRAVRPSASYSRSLAVLARAKEAGLTTKSGLIVGLGETDGEIHGALADLHGAGADIVTIGQYLRPTVRHLPVARWVEPAVFDEYAAVGRALGIAHVESSPLTRSSYHARQAAEAADASVSGAMAATATG